MKMKTFPITDIPEFSKKVRVVIIGIIGKSSFRHPNKTTPLIPSVSSDENGIQCFWDERNSILYLHAITYMDTNQLMVMASNFNQQKSEKDSDSSHWLVTAGDLAAESCRAMALVFHLSHIVVLSSPTHVFDMGYLQIFKAIDALRLELSQQTSEALSGLGGNWESHGRSCCPRLLFHFHRTPHQLKGNPAALKRLEHTVEDQLYLILRKARIITNVCAKALFAIPKNEEFVYMSTENAQARDISSLVQGLVDLCSGDPEAPPVERPTFREFLNGHVELAFGDGFDDNVGKYAMSTSFFELPSARSWREAARALSPIYLQYDVSKPGALYDALATDVRFSEARCAKVLPIAQASYNEGLPSHYSSQHHTLKLSQAISVFTAMARGPRAGAARARLAAACGAAWRAHRLCEDPSLTGNPCVEPEHDSSKDHSSGVRYISACNCGRTKSSREDPYSVRKANFGFYEQAANECGVCPTLAAIEFAVFQPSTTTFRAASIPGGLEPLEGTEAWAGGSGGWAGAGEALSPHSEETSPTQDPPLLLRGTGDKTITRQPSTTEYLPGMLHTLSPGGLLPAFSSWSLVCLGGASLYSAGPGLGEQLQPGLLPLAHHLPPWDARVEQPLSAWGGARRGKTHLTVKIFIGFEYECPRGHRFIMSSPDGASGGASSGAPSGGGARLARSDMPLHAACPARGGKCSLAQCTRVHVVTPKAPVHVTLQPRVQPIPGGPIFIPQPEEEGPIKLSASAYWILRFPFIYADERGPLPRPVGLQPSGLILAPMFGLAD